MTRPDPDIPAQPPIPNAGVKTVLLLVMAVLLLSGFALYVMTARGVFEENQRLVLLAENSEGVVIGMDMTFSGFAIGRVRRIELGDDGKAHIHVDVPTKDARWLRTSSVFTLERGVVGGARLRAYTGLLDAPPLPDEARRDVLIGDATAGIPLLVSTLRELADNLARITSPNSPLNSSIGNVQTLTGTMTGRHGALAGILGETGARQILESIERTNRLLTQTDAQLFGQDGLMASARHTSDELHAAIVDVRTLLADARGSLKKADAALDSARAVAVNARVATDDLDALRNEVEASLRKISSLVEEVNRKWPFVRDRELKLP